MKIIEGTFTADGQSETFTGRAVTIWVGTEGNTGFGGGTLKFWSRGQDAVKFSGTGISDDSYTLDSSYTEATVKTSVAYVGLAESYVELTGATSPSLSYKIHVED